jgi:hypothetical protein
LALFLLVEINKGKDSLFYYYLRNFLSVFKKIPMLYDYGSLNLFKNEEGISQINEALKQRKKIYNDLRRLLFSHGEAIKNQFVGSFLYGDYLWAWYKKIY